MKKRAKPPAPCYMCGGAHNSTYMHAACPSCEAAVVLRRCGVCSRALSGGLTTQVHGRAAHVECAALFEDAGVGTAPREQAAPPLQPLGAATLPLPDGAALAGHMQGTQVTPAALVYAQEAAAVASDVRGRRRRTRSRPKASATVSGAFHSNAYHQPSLDDLPLWESDATAPSRAFCATSVEGLLRRAVAAGLLRERRLAVGYFSPRSSAEPFLALVASELVDFLLATGTADCRGDAVRVATRAVSARLLIPRNALGVAAAAAPPSTSGPSLLQAAVVAPIEARFLDRSDALYSISWGKSNGGGGPREPPLRSGAMVGGATAVGPSTATPSASTRKAAFYSTLTQDTAPPPPQHKDDDSYVGLNVGGLSEQLNADGSPIANASFIPSNRMRPSSSFGAGDSLDGSLGDRASLSMLDSMRGRTSTILSSSLAAAAADAAAVVVEKAKTLDAMSRAAAAPQNFDSAEPRAALPPRTPRRPGRDVVAVPKAVSTPAPVPPSPAALTSPVSVIPTHTMTPARPKTASEVVPATGFSAFLKRAGVMFSRFRGKSFDEGNDSGAIIEGGEPDGGDRRGRARIITQSPVTDELNGDGGASGGASFSDVGVMSALDAAVDSDQDDRDSARGNFDDSAISAYLTSPASPPVGADAEWREARTRLVARAAQLASVVWRVGWMSKEGHLRRNWTRRWFVLRGATLSYYRRGPPNEAVAIAAVRAATAAGGSISVPVDVRVIAPAGAPAGEIDIREYGLEAATSTHSNLSARFVSRRVPDSQYLITADTEQDFVAWVKVVSGAMAQFEGLERERAALELARGVGSLLAAVARK